MTTDAATAQGSPVPTAVDSANDTRERMKLLTAQAPPTRRGWRDAPKRLTDISLALLLAPIALALVALAALAVKLTSAGPAFYAQTRVGRGGRLFKLIKLRTMRHRCEAQTGPCWSPPGDRRVTTVGRFLRATHLDELPQLWNVLRGDMSLVGPRPERPEIIAAEKLTDSIPGYAARLTVRPGLTGLAQLWLPPDTDIDSVRRKVALDLRYIENRGLVLDFRILTATFLKLLGIGPRLLRMPAPAGPRAIATTAEWRSALADVIGSPTAEPAQPAGDPRAEVREWFCSVAVPALNELASELRRHGRRVCIAAGRPEEAGIRAWDETGRRELDLKLRVRSTGGSPRVYARVLVREGRRDFVHEYPLDRPVSELSRAEVLAFLVTRYRASAASNS